MQKLRHRSTRISLLLYQITLSCGSMCPINLYFFQIYGSTEKSGGEKEEFFFSPNLVKNFPRRLQLTSIPKSSSSYIKSAPVECFSFMVNHNCTLSRLPPDQNCIHTKLGFFHFATSAPRFLYITHFRCCPIHSNF